MFLSLIYIELVKYKRTAVIWMIVIGGFFSAGTACLMVFSNARKAGWEAYAATGFNCINLLALLLVAVFTGYVIVGEYHGSTISTIFTYPISRLKLLAVKYLVIVFFTAAFYLVFFLSVMLFGVLSIGDIPSGEFTLDLIKYCLILTGMNFVLVPVTAIISLVIRGAATYLFAGMGYFITYISFMNSDYSYLIPTCMPNKIIENKFISEVLTDADFNKMIAVSAVTLIIGMILSCIHYVRSDCR